MENTLSIPKKSWLSYTIDGKFRRIYNPSEDDIKRLFKEVISIGNYGSVGYEIEDDCVNSQLSLDIEKKIYRITYGIFGRDGEDKVYVLYPRDTQVPDKAVEFKGEMLGSETLFQNLSIAERLFREFYVNGTLNLKNFL